MSSTKKETYKRPQEVTDRRNAYAREQYRLNRDYELERSKEYYQKNKEAQLEKTGQYQEQNRERRFQIINCECGSQYKYHHKARHLKIS